MDPYSFFPPVCQVYLTRHCNESCSSCKLRDNRFPDMPQKFWREVAMHLSDNGVRFLKVMGGEPTLVSWLPSFIRFVEKETEMHVVVLSNCEFPSGVGRELAQAGMWGFFASYDYVSPDAIDKGMQRKTSYALETLLEMKRAGVYIVGANVVVAPHSLDHIVEIVRELSSLGIWVNLCPVIWGEGDFIFRGADGSNRLTREHMRQVLRLGNILVEMRRRGEALLTGSDQYYWNMGAQGIRLEWHCKNEPPILQLDADGSLLACPDVRGSKPPAILDIKTFADYEEYCRRWRQDVKKCQGCYWSAAYSGGEDLWGLPRYAW